MKNDELMIRLIEMRLRAGTVVKWRGVWVMMLDQEHVAVRCKEGDFIYEIDSFREWWEKWVRRLN